ncbi:MAG: hypothetical protein AAF441_05495 [Pseudomonadota bacterium]
MPDLEQLTLEERLRLHLGPYEQWMVFNGRKYLPEELQSRADGAQSVIVEAPGGLSKRDFNFLFGRPGDPTTLSEYETDFSQLLKLTLVPTLWMPRGVWRLQFGLSYVPFLIRIPEFAEALNLLDRFAAVVPEGVDKAITRDLKQRPKRSPVLHFGFPLPNQVVNESFRYRSIRDDKNLIKPDWDAVDKKKRIVVVGIIDDGIPFANRNFVNDQSGRTRIDYYWNQSAEAEQGSAVQFGRELTGTQIDAQITKHGSDEDAVYREARVLGGDGLPRGPLNNFSSHGAHVLDLLAGNQAGEIDDQTQIRIVAVDLPTSTTWDTSGFGKDMFVLSAMHYIFDRADRIASQYEVDERFAPVVVNLSYGYSGGPHDGTGQIEAAMDELVLNRRKVAPTALVMPSGNMFLDRLHAVITGEHLSSEEGGDGSKTLHWRVQPNDRTSSFLEMWFPEYTEIERFGLEVRSPTNLREGAAEPTLDLELGADLTGLTFETKTYPIGGSSGDGWIGNRQGTKNGAPVIGEVSIHRYRNNRWQVVVSLAPTEPSDVDLPAAPSGTWTLRLKRLDSETIKEGFLPVRRNGRRDPVPGDVECWIQRDISYGSGNTGARQSYFDDPDNMLYWKDGRPAVYDSSKAYVRRFGSFNGMATGAAVLAVGGTVASNDEMADFSSAGPLRNPAGLESTIQVGRQVDCCAPSDLSPYNRGLPAAATRSGARVSLRGTSAASPQVARCLAQKFLTADLNRLHNNSSNNYFSSLQDDYYFKSTERQRHVTTQAKLGRGRMSRRRSR